MARQRTGFVLGLEVAKGEAQVGELFGRGREQEVGLIAIRVRGAVQLGAGRAAEALDVVPRRHAIGIEVARGREQVLELHPLVAADAGHGGGAGEVAVGEVFDHRFLEKVLVVENVMRKAHLFGHAAGIVDVDPGAAGIGLGERRAVVVELEGHADHVVALILQHRRHDRRIDPARHRHHHARLGRAFGKAQRIQRCIGGS